MRAFLSWKGAGSRIPAALAAAYLLAGALPAAAQDATAAAQDGAAPRENALPPAEDDAQPLDSGTDLVSAQTVSALADFRIVGADGSPSWLDHGFGKTRFDGTSDGSFQIIPYPVQATLMWQPRFTSWLGARVSAGWQLYQKHEIDVMEAFLTFRPSPQARTRISGRAGIFWPNISLEHAGAAWSVTETITPSAINAWISEETKLLGIEATLTTMVGEHEVSLTGAAFGFNDTSGTLLSFRGWALHDVNATVFGYFPLPPLNNFMIHIQAPETKSFIEIDDRVGFYGNFEWRPPWPFGLNIFYYDNRGDPKVFNSDLQWGWRTRFWNVGFNADLGPNTRLLAQALTGTTLMGFQSGGVEWVDTRFRAAYLLVRHNLGRAAVSGRLDLFETRERGSQMDRANESEEGWAVTAAGRFTLTDQMSLFLEAMHVRSDRGVRQRVGLPPVENQTVVQLGLRLNL
jgi:hypothetical protein